MSFSKLSGMSDISVEDERDFYKEKFENLKLVIKKLHQDQRSNSARLRGAETIASLLKDSRMENQRLIEENANLRSSLTLLQKRLVSVGASASLKLQDGDSLNPGLSRQLLDNLIEENTRLKDLIKYSNCEPERLDQLTKEVHSLQKRVENLTEENAVLKAEKESLTAVLASCDDKKDKEILRLHMCVEAYEKNRQTSDVLCQSLVDETMELKHKLQTTGEMCHRLAQNLHSDSRRTKMTPSGTEIGVQVSEFDTSPVRSGAVGGLLTSTTPSPHSPCSPENFKTEALKSQLSSSSSSSDDSVQMALLNQKLIFLQGENRKYKTQLEQVIEHNGQWQQYNSEREGYVKNLQEQIRSLTEQLEGAVSDKNRHDAAADREKQQREVDQLLMAAKQRQETVMEEKEQLEDETRKILVDLRTAQDRISGLEAELREVKSRSHSFQQNKEYVDKIQMLEAQVQIFSDDFKSERRDRERAQARCTHLEEELGLYKQQLESFQTKICYDAVRERQRAMQIYEQEHEERKRLGLSQGTAIARGLTKPIEASDYTEEKRTNYPRYVMDTEDLHEDEMGEDVIDSLPEPREEILQCSRCDKEFPLSRHEELLEHIEICDA